MAGSADGTPQDAAAEARLAEMLGCAPPSSRHNTGADANSGPIDGAFFSRTSHSSTVHLLARSLIEYMYVYTGDCDVNLMMRLEEWGFSHEFTMKSFKTFPFNHASASYAILEDKLIGQRE